MFNIPPNFNQQQNQEQTGMIGTPERGQYPPPMMMSPYYQRMMEMMQSPEEDLSFIDLLKTDPVEAYKRFRANLYKKGPRRGGNLFETKAG